MGGRPLVHRFREAGELNLICPQAVKSKKHIPIQVILATGESLTVSVDSASTSREVCMHIAHKQGLSDHLGFSLQVAVYDKVLASHPARHPPPSYTQGGHPETQPLSPIQPGHRLPSQPPGTGRCTHTHTHTASSLSSRAHMVTSQLHLSPSSAACTTGPHAAATHRHQALTPVSCSKLPHAQELWTSLQQTWRVTPAQTLTAHTGTPNSTPSDWTHTSLPTKAPKAESYRPDSCLPS